MLQYLEKKFEKKALNLVGGACDEVKNAWNRPNFDIEGVFYKRCEVLYKSVTQTLSNKVMIEIDDEWNWMNEATWLTIRIAAEACHLKLIL